ncbi:hypothetical protein [Shewanella insulae]|uniref:hypothetical protein n=1 Tax=Shewanella insulae TaxID=2681496 RepID=UPI00247FF73F|nr:hypothetical protein [Shewanella insulae]
MMRLWRKKQAKPETEQDHVMVAYQMNEFSHDARQLAGIFSDFVNGKKMTLLPGRYGGEYNNDMLAFGEMDGRQTLLLGLKVTGTDGGIQLDRMSMGPFTQCTLPWLRMVLHSLVSLGGQESLISNIEQALASGELLMAVVFIDRDTRKLNMLPVVLD